jgi:hypothetical protein
MTPIRRLALIASAVAVLSAGPLVSQAEARHMHNEYCPPSHRYDGRYEDGYDRDDYLYDSGYDSYGGYDRDDRGYDPYSENRDFELKRDWPMLLGIFLGGGLGAGVGGASPY